MALAALRQKLELQDFYEWLDEADQKERQKENEAKGKSEAGEQQAPAQLGKQAEKLIDSLLTTTDDDIANKISQIVTQISKKVCFFPPPPPSSLLSSSSLHPLIFLSPLSLYPFLPSSYPSIGLPSSYWLSASLPSLILLPSPLSPTALS